MIQETAQPEWGILTYRMTGKGNGSKAAVWVKNGSREMDDSSESVSHTYYRPGTRQALFHLTLVILTEILGGWNITPILHSQIFKPK